MTNPPDPGERDSSNWSNPGGQWGAPDEGSYHTPGSQSPSDQYSDPGQYPPAGQYQHPGPGGAPGQVPPPPGSFIPAQPGIIPLHPLGLGQIYDGAFKAIRANPMVMFVFSAIILTLSTVVQLVLASSFLTDYFSFLGLAEQNPEALASFTDDDLFAMFSGAMLPMLIGAAFSFIASTVLNGMLTFAVSQAVLGFKPGLGEVWEQAKGQLLRLVGLVLLIAVITAVVPVLLVLLTVASTFADSVALTVIVGLLSALGSFVWILFVITATALATPALMLEGCGPIAALRRGWLLARPSFWRVLGYYLLTTIIAAMVTYIITMPFTMVSFILPPTAIIFAQGVSTIIASTLVTPFVASVIALLYIDIRIRREGLAAELAAAAR